MKIDNTGVRGRVDPGARGEEKMRVERKVLSLDALSSLFTRFYKRRPETDIWKI